MKLLSAFFLIISASGCLAQVIPLPNAHAHNDYEHTRPLMDALENGFTSVEADVFLVDDILYVYHDLPAVLDRERTLEKLYLKPLQKIIEENSGKSPPTNSRGQQINAEGDSTVATYCIDFDPNNKTYRDKKVHKSTLKGRWVSEPYQKKK